MTGAFGLYDIGNNQIAGAHPVAQIGMEWTMTGIAPTR
jgi:hypothetical protein